MVDANGPNFDGSSQLDLGEDKRKSLSPDSKRSGIIGTSGSPVNPILGAAGIQASNKTGAIAGGPPVAADLMPVKQSSSGGSGKNAGKDAKGGVDPAGSQESDSFYKMYNKEIKVNQDEIPIILAELTDAAHNFIQRENYEKALILLQKTEGVLEVVSLEGCSRDRYVSFITYNNMSMCYQKIGMLDECIFYLKQSIALISDQKFYKSKKISQRSRRVNQECKLKLQLCAILSQNQNHSEALENARKSVRLSHQMFKDMEELCQIYIDKINYRDNLLAAQEQSDLEDAERVQLISMVLESSPVREIPKNFLEQSISLVERSSLKMFPVLREVRRRVVNSEIPPEAEKKNKEERSSEEKGMDDEDEEEEKPDMRSVLGFLNQNEWIYNLNIGNIMQIQPIAMKEFLAETNDEGELSRDSFLSKLAILIVTYFCMSTEMRFLLQSRAQYLKPEVKKERELESEYWHAKALEIACTFLPSECPLLNHVLLSYQKHHDPTMQPIQEDEESQDVLSVLRPLKGIEQSKYQPIIRTLPQVKVAMSPLTDQIPLKELLRQFDNDQIEQVLNLNASRVRRVVEISEKEVQAVQEINQNSPTQANLSAIVLAVGDKSGYQHHALDGAENSEMIGVDNSCNILPLSLNESQNEGLASRPLSGESQQTSTMKLKQEMYLHEQSMLDVHNEFENNRSSIQGLEEQLMAAVESPNRQTAGQNEHKPSEFQFDSRDDSFPGMGDFESGDLEGENKMYDLIIAKVMSNPRIDKRTLLQKFISKIEMESNMHAGLSSELSQIKHMIAKEPTDADSIINGNTKQHASSQIEQQAPQLLEQAEKAREGAQSMQQIVMMQAFDEQNGQPEDDSEILLNVPSETMAGQTGVQDARPSRDHKRPKGQKPMSAKLNASGRGDQHKSRIDTSTRTRSSSHQMKSSANKHHHTGGHSKRNPHAKVPESKDYRKVKSYLEEESLFKDIERSTEYQDPLNLNVMEQSVHTENNAPVDPEEIQLEQKSSHQSQSRSNSRKKYPQHHSSIQSSDQNVRNNLRDGQSSSNKKSFTISRPSTAVTNATRYSSVNLRKGRRRQHGQNHHGHPQKTLIAKELEEPMRQSRSESSSRGRYQKYQTRYSQNRTSEPKDPVIGTNLAQNAKNNTSQGRLKHSQARKRLSVNQYQANLAHGQSVEHKPSHNESRVLNKVSHKKLTSNKHHNLSVQASGPPPQHHMTSKIKKLVSHKQIETNLNNKKQTKFSRQKLSQTKNVLQQNKFSSNNNHAAQGTRGRQTRQRKNESKSKSQSRSSGQRTYSGSSKHLKSRSNQRSGSDNRRNMYNELAQYSFDLIDGDQVNINATSAHQLMLQHSKNDLQRQVLENQKTILGLLSKQRTSSNDSRKSRSQNRKKSQQFTGLANMQDLVPKKQSTSSKNQQRLSQNNMSISSQAQILKPTHVISSQQQLEPHLQFGSNQTQLINGSQGRMENDGSQINRGRSSGNQGMQNSASQHVQGLSNFIKQINSSKRSEQQNNKSLQYLKKQQKMMNVKGMSQPARAKGTKKTTGRDQQPQMQMGQNEFKQSLMTEIRHLQNRLQEHLKQASESSPVRMKSGSQKRSGGERSISKSRSRSPTQPTKALIPKKKSFSKLLAHSKNMNFTTNEVGQQFNESLLNMSTGEQVRPSRAHATSKLAKRKIESLMHNQALKGDNKVAYNSFDEPAVGDLSGPGNLAHAGQGNAHHSLSMFDSEVQVSKVNQFVPLHHQLSQNAILAPQPLSQHYILGNNHQRGNDTNQRQVSSSKQFAATKPTRIQKQRASQNSGPNYRTNPSMQTKAKLTKN